MQKKYGEDKIKSIFGRKLKFSAAQKPSTTSNINIQDATANAASDVLGFFTMGWALKIRHHVGYTNDQWNFLFELFHLGELTSKITPQRAHEQMKLARNDDDLFRFKPEEVFAPSKIKEIFNRMKQLHKKGELRMRFNDEVSSTYRGELCLCDSYVIATGNFENVFFYFRSNEIYFWKVQQAFLIV